MKQKRKGGRRRFLGTRKPNRQVTYQDLLQLGPDELEVNPDTGIRLYLDRMEELTNFGALLAKFYYINDGQEPLALRLIDDVYSPIANAKIYQIVMRGSFHIDIEPHHSATSGPHRTRLWFRSFSKPVETHWLASLQLMAFFYNEEQIREELKKEIAEKNFFMLPSNADKPVKL